MFFKAILDISFNKTELFIDGKRIERVTSLLINQSNEKCPEITITFIPENAEIDFNSGGFNPKEKSFKIVGNKTEGSIPKLKPIPKKKKPIIKEKEIDDLSIDDFDEIPF
jgi:hypothetical protein